MSPKNKTVRNAWFAIPERNHRRRNQRLAESAANTHYHAKSNKT